MGGLDNPLTPVAAPQGGSIDNPDSESVLVSDRLRRVEVRLDDLEALQREGLTASGAIVAQLQISNALSKEQTDFWKRKEDREVAAIEASKEARLAEIKHNQKLQEARWRWFSTDFAKNALWPFVAAIVGAIGAAVGYFFRGGGP